MTWIVNGKQMTNAEYEEHQRQEREAKARVQQEQMALVKRLGETYEALTALMQQHPEVNREITDKTAMDEEIYGKLRQNLHRANEAPRCRWVRQDGTICGSPQMRKHIYCFAHKQMMEARALALRLPPPEDANAIQISVQRVQTALIDETISAKTAGLLLYSLQLAMTNVGRTTFGQADEEMVTNVANEEEALSEKALSTQQSAISKNQNQPQDQRPPLIHTDDTDPGSGDRVIGASGDRKSKTEARLTADERGWGRDLPLIHTDDTDPRLGDRVIGASGDGKSKTEARLTADERGLGRDLPLVHTDDTDDTDPRSGDRVIGASGDRKSKTEARLTADERGLEEHEEEESQVVTMRM